MATTQPQTINFAIAAGDSLQIEVRLDDVPVGVTPTLAWRFAAALTPETTIYEATATATQASSVWSALLTVERAASAANLPHAARGYVHRVHVYSGATLRATPIVGVVSVSRAEND